MQELSIDVIYTLGLILGFALGFIITIPVTDDKE